MTYNGGIEDGKAALATQILNIMRNNRKPLDQLAYIRSICEKYQKVITERERELRQQHYETF